MLRKPPASFPSAWLTICVLIDKGIPKESKDGRRFAMWKFSDLRVPWQRDNHFVFLHGGRTRLRSPGNSGSVYALLTPEALPPRTACSEPALTIKHPSSCFVSASQSSLVSARRIARMAGDARWR